MGLNGLEPSTSRLSGVRSNQLSYKPIIESGNHLLSQAVTHQVSSAVYVLTIVFGMGTGVSHKRIITGNFMFNCFIEHSKLNTKEFLSLTYFLRKEVIQPHLPIRLPCYDFTPVTGFTFGCSFFTVRSQTSGASNSHGVTGGVYKTRERIHRDILIRDY